MSIKDKTVQFPVAYSECERGNVYLVDDEGNHIAWLHVEDNFRLEVSVTPENYPALNVRLVELADVELFHHIRRKLIGWTPLKLNLDYDVAVQYGVVKDTLARPSEQMVRVFEAEWDNLPSGESTLQSIKDSLVQMPTDVLVKLLGVDYDKFDRKDFEYELEELIADWGKDTTSYCLLDD